MKVEFNARLVTLKKGEVIVKLNSRLVIQKYGEVIEEFNARKKEKRREEEFYARLEIQN